MHVRDLDAGDRPPGGPERQSAAGIVCVDVRTLRRTRVADDEQGIAEPAELVLEPVGVEPVAFDDEDGAVAELGELLMDEVDRRDLRRLERRLRKRLAGQRGCDAADDFDQPGRPGIDDAGLRQHGQHLLRPDDAGLAASDDGSQVSPALGLLGELADRGQHRSLDGLADGAVGGVARAPQRAGQVVGLAERLGRAPDDLREDHARVPPRPHQGGPRHLAGELGAILALGRLERLDDRAHGERQVRARVAVRHRIHVQVVDPPPVGVGRGERTPDELGHPRPPLTPVTRTSSTTTSTAATGSPVNRSTS